MRKTLAMALSAAVLFAPATAQSAQDDKKWDVNNPPAKTRNIPINVDEGSWMNVDVSADGQTIAFDLLGDIYTMPITGGTPKNIASGLAYEQQPRFSPDGTKIVFTSDRGGGDNIWVMNVDGSDKRAITDEKFRLLNSPAWSKDGQYIIARKHFTTNRSAGTGEIWMYHIGGGDGVALVERPNPQHQKELGEPVFSADGTKIYFTRNVTSGPIFEYAQNTNDEIFAIESYDMSTGEREKVVGGPGGAVRPAPSPDGKTLAFVKRERAKSKLYIKDMTSGEIRKIYDDMDQDMQETWAVHGVYPTMDWTADSQNVVFWAGGKIRKVNIATGEASVIPFKVSDTRQAIAPIHPKRELAPDNVSVKMPRFAALSPNGGALAFEALGRLHMQNQAGGAVTAPLGSDASAREFFMSWSRDGSQLAFVHWTDAGLGELHVMAAATGEVRTVSSHPGHYRNPQFSPDGTKLVYEAGAGGGLVSEKWGDHDGLYLLDLTTGTEKRIATSGSRPHFGADNDRIYFSSYGGGKIMLNSTDLNGHDQRTHASGALTSDYMVSPDGKNLAFEENYNVYVMPFPAVNTEIGAGKTGNALPVTRVSKYGASYMHWSHGGAQINWSLGPVLYSAQMSDIFPNGAKAAKFTPPSSGRAMTVTVAADKPSGVVAFTNARIITMADKDGGVIENGTIVITNNRITAVGANVTIPAGAKTMDLAGKTIMPGLIDAHAHGPHGSDDIIPQQNWNTIAHLALGVTTVHDPSNRASHIHAAKEYRRAGLYLAPRLFSTGEIIYGAKAPGVYAEINGLDDARDHIERLKAQGAGSVKNYNQPRREQRQQVVIASQAANIASVAEGGALFSMDINLIADGNSTLEHNIPQSVFYEDVLSFFAQTGVNYTPTLVVSYAGPRGDSYWRAYSEVWKHPILSAHVPTGYLEASSVRRELAPEEDYADDEAAREAHKLAKRGVAVSIGAHGQEEGLAAHWELWSFVRGGMTPLESLRAGTIESARSLGMVDDIGSLEQGKLADLVILNENPLEDIGNSDKISHVMLNGRLYNAVTMNEELTGNFVRQPYWWEAQ